MHTKIEKLLSMIKAQEQQSSESFDALKQILIEILKCSKETSNTKSQWIIK